MAHFANIETENGVQIVKNVLVIPNEQEHRGQEYLNELGLPGTWIQCSYNTRGGKHLTGGTPLRMNYPYPGSVYDPVKDAFILPKKYPSWILDELTCLWIAPVPYPSDKKPYVWNEGIVNWTLHPENPSGPYAWNEQTYSWSFAPTDGKTYRWDKQTNSWVEVTNS